jgi:hypothetical protein
MGTLSQMIDEHFRKKIVRCDVLLIAHIESSLIWIGSLKVEWCGLSTIK